MIIEKINDVSLPILQRRSLSDYRDFWILRLETLPPKSLNNSLNDPQDTIGKAILVPPKPRRHVIYSFIFQVSGITWMSSANNK